MISSTTISSASSSRTSRRQQANIVSPGGQPAAGHAPDPSLVEAMTQQQHLLGVGQKYTANTDDDFAGHRPRLSRRAAVAAPSAKYAPAGE